MSNHRKRKTVKCRIIDLDQDNFINTDETISLNEQPNGTCMSTAERILINLIQPNGLEEQSIHSSINTFNNANSANNTTNPRDFNDYAGNTTNGDDQLQIIKSFKKKSNKKPTIVSTHLVHQLESSLIVPMTVVLNGPDYRDSQSLVAEEWTTCVEIDDTNIVPSDTDIIAPTEPQFLSHNLIDMLSLRDYNYLHLDRPTHCFFNIPIKLIQQSILPFLLPNDQLTLSLLCRYTYYNFPPSFNSCQYFDATQSNINDNHNDLVKVDEQKNTISDESTTKLQSDYLLESKYTPFDYTREVKLTATCDDSKTFFPMHKQLKNFNTLLLSIVNDSTYTIEDSHISPNILIETPICAHTSYYFQQLTYVYIASNLQCCENGIIHLIDDTTSVSNITIGDHMYDIIVRSTILNSIGLTQYCLMNIFKQNLTNTSLFIESNPSHTLTNQSHQSEGCDEDLYHEVLLNHALYILASALSNSARLSIHEQPHNMKFPFKHITLSNANFIPLLFPIVIVNDYAKLTTYSNNIVESDPDNTKPRVEFTFLETINITFPIPYLIPNDITENILKDLTKNASDLTNMIASMSANAVKPSLFQHTTEDFNKSELPTIKIHHLSPMRLLCDMFQSRLNDVILTHVSLLELHYLTETIQPLQLNTKSVHLVINQTPFDYIQQHASSNATRSEPSQDGQDQPVSYDNTFENVLLSFLSCCNETRLETLIIEYEIMTCLISGDNFVKNNPINVNVDLTRLIITILSKFRNLKTLKIGSNNNQKGKNHHLQKIITINLDDVIYNSPLSHYPHYQLMTLSLDASVSIELGEGCGGDDTMDIFHEESTVSQYSTLEHQNSPPSSSVTKTNETIKVLFQLICPNLMIFE